MCVCIYIYTHTGHQTSLTIKAYKPASRSKRLFFTLLSWKGLAHMVLFHSTSFYQEFVTHN